MPSGVAAMAAGIRDIVGLPDPVREVTRKWQRPNGLEVGKMRIPLGVITIIYEARPNVTADAASLCIKSGNAVILRGGSEARFSNRAIGEVLRQACVEAGAPEDAVQVVGSTDRAMIHELLKLEEYVDLIIPRGGEELIRFVAANSLVPVVKHYKGVCHVYVDSDADLDMAERISLNAKVQRPSVCNAMETLLVHEAVASRFLPDVIGKLRESGVEVRGCDKTRALVGGIPAASEADWHEEYLDLVLAVRVVADMDEAIEHIRQYGSDHTETIVDRRPRQGRGIRRAGQLVGGAGQRVHPLQRRRRARPRRRDRHQHQQDPRLRPHGAGRAHEHQVLRLRRWTGPHLAVFSPLPPEEG